MANKVADDFAFIKSKMAKDSGLAPLGVGRVKVKQMSGLPDMPGQWLYITASGYVELCRLDQSNIDRYKREGSSTKWVGLVVVG